MQAYCYWYAEKKETRLFERVNRFGLWHIPFCKKCARYVGKRWDHPSVPESEMSTREVRHERL